MKLKLAQLERLEDTDTRSKKSEAMDPRPTSAASACGSEPLMDQQPPMSRVSQESTLMHSPEGTPFSTSPLLNSYSIVYNIDDLQGRYVNTNVYVHEYNNPHPIPISQFESITPSVVCDQQKNSLVNDMATFPFECYNMSPESFWMFQQAEVNAMT